MITLSDDEVVLLRSLLMALRGIKVRDIDKPWLCCHKTIRLWALHNGGMNRGEI